MRQNISIVLLTVIATLLAVKVFSPTPSVQGQNAGGTTATVGTEIVAATGSLMGSQGSALYLYDSAKRKLVVYFLGNKGLEIRAVRDLTFDLQAKEFNLDIPGKIVTVDAMRKAVMKMETKTKKEEKETPETE